MKTETVQQNFVNFQKQTNWVKEYSEFDTKKFEKELKNKKPEFWEKVAEEKALKVFEFASKTVPAYKDFLKKNKVNLSKVRSIEDFKHVPTINKQNYIAEYELKDRVSANSKGFVVAASSGTSGEPKFWPRGGYQEFEAGVIHELFYRSAFALGSKKTLIVIGFPMGVYVSGMATVLPTWLVSQKPEYNLSIASVGNNKNELLRVVSNLHMDYEQVILVGHPFFIKDCIETGKSEGIKWSKMNLGLFFCSEGFTEGWRDYVASEAGLGIGTERIISTYGCSEMLLIGNETPLTLKLRRFLTKNTKVNTELFGETLVPSLFQYNPLFRYIEQVQGNLVFTSASGTPLVRFDLKDAGKLMSFKTVQEKMSTLEMKDLLETSANLPLVALKGRSDHTIIFYAANIYPEHIHQALNQKPFLKFLTGKFTLKKLYKKNMDEYLEVHVESRPGVIVKGGFSEKIKSTILHTLLKLNMEYKDMKSHMQKDVVPEVVIHPYQDEVYFKPGLKPKYII